MSAIYLSSRQAGILIIYSEEQSQGGGEGGREGRIEREREGGEAVAASVGGICY